MSPSQPDSSPMPDAGAQFVPTTRPLLPAQPFARKYQVQFNDPNASRNANVVAAARHMAAVRAATNGEKPSLQLDPSRDSAFGCQ